VVFGHDSEMSDDNSGCLPAPIADRRDGADALCLDRNRCQRLNLLGVATKGYLDLPVTGALMQFTTP
jgi:hypothetical protein